MKKKLDFILHCFFFIAFFFNLQFSLKGQNVGINAIGSTPNASSILDLNTGNTFSGTNGKGLIIPNVTLSSTSDATTIGTGNVTSLLVYNTTAAGSGATAVLANTYYYWNGVKWVTFSGQGSNDWALLGNAGTTVGTNFLGTTDSVNLQFKANNQLAGLIDLGSQQTFFGYKAGYSSTSSATLATFMGYKAGTGNTTGDGNTALGFSVLLYNSTANDNTMIGVDAGYFLSGGYNTAVGMWSLEGSSTVASNTGVANSALGFCAGSGYNGVLYSGTNNNNLQVTSGSYNTFLGYSTGISAGTYSNTTTLGAFSKAGQSDALILGSINGVNGATNSAKVGIGTTTPGAALDIVVPASSAINGINVDVSAGNSTGNAIYAVSVGIPNYSSIYTVSSPTVAGTGFSTTLSNHTLYANINNNQPYSFASYGRIAGAGVPSGGVMGYWASSLWGALGYYSTASAKYGAYVNATAVGATTYGNGAGRQLTDNTLPVVLEATGLGAYGDLFGAWIRGNVYGLALKGERTSLYVDGKTVVNQPIIELSKGENEKTIVNYTSVSATADLQMHGVANLQNGLATVAIEASTLNQFASIEDLTIIATPSGQTNGVYAVLSNGNLTIKENNGGSSNVKVSWIIIGKRNMAEDFVPSELTEKDFDKNLREFMHNENDTNSPLPENLWWDGSKLNKGNVPKTPK